MGSPITFCGKPSICSWKNRKESHLRFLITHIKASISVRNGGFYDRTDRLPHLSFFYMAEMEELIIFTFHKSEAVACVYLDFLNFSGAFYQTAKSNNQLHSWVAHKNAMRLPHDSQ